MVMKTHGINPIIMDTPKISVASTTTAATVSTQAAVVEIRSSGMIHANATQPRSPAALFQLRLSGIRVNPIQINANVEQPGQTHVKNQIAQRLPS